MCAWRETQTVGSTSRYHMYKATDYLPCDVHRRTPHHSVLQICRYYHAKEVVSVWGKSVLENCLFKAEWQDCDGYLVFSLLW